MSVTIQPKRFTVTIDAQEKTISLSSRLTNISVDTTAKTIEIQSTGTQGPVGPGVATGGTTGQILIKNSNTNYDTAWANPPSSGVSSFNTRIGDVTLDSSDVTDALTFTPEDVSNKVQNLSSPDAATYPSTDAVSNAIENLLGSTFETVSKNLKQYDYTLNYTGDVLDSIVYTVPSVGTITKTLTYSLGKLTTVVLSGNTPSGINLTKTLTYTLGQLTSITYS
jgi:hypothetical protein